MKRELFCAMLLGFLLDCLLGDPRTIPHPVVCMGKLISWLEKAFRALFPKTRLGENLAGGCIWLVTVAVSFLIPWGLLKLAGMVSPWLRLLLQAIFCSCSSVSSLSPEECSTSHLAVYTSLGA